MLDCVYQVSCCPKTERVLVHCYRFGSNFGVHSVFDADFGVIHSELQQSEQDDDEQQCSELCLAVLLADPVTYQQAKHLHRCLLFCEAILVCDGCCMKSLLSLT